jgi:hypothetical protein
MRAEYYDCPFCEERPSLQEQLAALREQKEAMLLHNRIKCHAAILGVSGALMIVALFIMWIS